MSLMNSNETRIQSAGGKWEVISHTEAWVEDCATYEAAVKSIALSGYVKLVEGSKKQGWAVFAK